VSIELIMATRPIFLPGNASHREVRTVPVDFKWHSGLSLSQKRKSIQSFHESAITQGYCARPLEISSRSENSLGVNLSAFNLKLTLASGRMSTVESIFQSAKVFENGGPYTDLLEADSKTAKRDCRLRESGPLKAFFHEGVTWSLEPKTAFYDWLYISALLQNGISQQLAEYDGFTDIEFNPAKSLNCQAHSASVFLTLLTNEAIKSAITSREKFIDALLRIEPHIPC